MQVHFTLRVFAEFRPEFTVKVVELLEAERTADSRNQSAGDGGSFNRNRAGTAEGIQKRHIGRPSRKLQEAGRHVFLQRSLTLIGSPAALEERFAGEINVKRAVLLIEERRDLNIRRLAADVRTGAGDLTEPVADSVLDAQRREFERLQRRAVSGNRNAERLIRREKELPGRTAGLLINVAAVPVVMERDLHHHAGRDPGAEAREVGSLDRALKHHAGRCLAGALSAACRELFLEHGLKSPGTGGVKAVVLLILHFFPNKRGSVRRPL